MTNKTFLLISCLSSITMIIILINVPLHPIHMMIFLLIYNTTLCLNMSTWKPTFIFSILFFLIMISGLMIIFLYFSSLISNEKTWINMNVNSMIIMSLLTLLIILFLMMLNAPLFAPPLPIHLDASPSLFTPFYLKFSSTAPLFHAPLMHLTMLNMIYLLLAMFMVMKMCAPKIKSMRKLT